ncbi:GNAT family N-acetyltransferase [Oryzifoliimicrobium ureilyticus]|uniref:GNAT family N-acetyltransferase n=1 Tax=Oryzifoliimicrobium ureilyticus TaxID=3113724 RepID=UPI0030764277
MTETILETERLMLVMWDRGDADLIQSLHSSMATTQFMADRAPWSIEKCQLRLAGWFAEHQTFGTTKYKLIERATGRFIGRAGISPDAVSTDYELGYALCEDAWNKGFATEIARSLVSWFLHVRYRRG